MSQANVLQQQRAEMEAWKTEKPNVFFAYAASHFPSEGKKKVQAHGQVTHANSVRHRGAWLQSRHVGGQPRRWGASSAAGFAHHPVDRLMERLRGSATEPSLQK